MSSGQQLVLDAQKAPQVTQALIETNQMSMIQAIQRAAADPNTNIDKMERLLEMAKGMEADRRKDAFYAALTLLQATLPQIEKTGRIVVKGTERSRYAKIEDIDISIRPYLAEHGFAFSYDTDSPDAKLFRISCKMSHREGHSETKTLTLPIDSSDYRSAVQSIGSTVSYGKRQLIKMHLNLVERAEDDDGHGGADVISLEQSRSVNDLIDEVRADRVRFLKHFGIDKIAELRANQYAAAINMLETKRRAGR